LRSKTKPLAQAEQLYMVMAAQLGGTFPTLTQAVASLDGRKPWPHWRQVGGVAELMEVQFAILPVALTQPVVVRMSPEVHAEGCVRLRDVNAFIGSCVEVALSGTGEAVAVAVGEGAVSLRDVVALDSVVDIAVDEVAEVAVAVDADQTTRTTLRPDPPAKKAKKSQ